MRRRAGTNESDAAEDLDDGGKENKHGYSVAAGMSGWLRPTGGSFAR